MAEAEKRLKADDIIREIKRAGIGFVAFLPDRLTSYHLLKGVLEDSELNTVQVCKEDEGVSICSGLYCAGKRSLLLMQYTGLLDSINAIRGIAVQIKNPVCMMVGLLGKEPGVEPARSARYGLRIVEPILDAMGIEHHLIERPEDTAKILPAIEGAYGRPGPVVLLIGREPV